MADFPDDETVEDLGAEGWTTSIVHGAFLPAEGVPDGSSRAWTSDRTCTSMA